MTNVRNPPFSAALPSAIESLPSAEERTESGIRKLPLQTNRGRPRVLLIAPSPVRGERYSRALSADCDVEVVESAARAFQVLVYDRNFRMILCPGSIEGAGSAFLTQLRQLNLLGCPRVVIFDGSEDAREVIEAIQLGVRQYLPGPCPPSELARKVSRLLGLT